MLEEWKVIEEFPIYYVSNMGNVKNSVTGNILVGGLDKNGYRQVTICYKGKQYSRRICRLVAKAFLANPDNLPQVNHKDEIVSNDNVNNLEWCTAKYNVNYGSRTQKTMRRVKCVETGIVYNGLREASRILGLNHQNIGEACKTHNACGGFHWEYD